MIYLRTYGIGSRQNERVTLAKSVQFGDLTGKISDPVIKTAVAKYTYHPPVHLWDFGIRASAHLKPGDTAYIQCEDTLYYSKILEKIDDVGGEIGDLVGWHRIQQQPWKNPVVLKPLVQLHGLPPVLGYLKGHVAVEDNFYKLVE